MQIKHNLISIIMLLGFGIQAADSKHRTVKIPGELISYSFNRTCKESLVFHAEQTADKKKTVIVTLYCKEKNATIEELVDLTLELIDTFLSRAIKDKKEKIEEIIERRRTSCNIKETSRFSALSIAYLVLGQKKLSAKFIRPDEKELYLIEIAYTLEKFKEKFFCYGNNEHMKSDSKSCTSREEATRLKTIHEEQPFFMIVNIKNWKKSIGQETTSPENTHPIKKHESPRKAPLGSSPINKHVSRIRDLDLDLA